MARLFIIFLLGLITSCNSNSKSLPKEVQPAREMQPKSDRKNNLISELKRLKTILDSKDPREIKRVFSFPIPDSILSIYSEDSLFEKQKQLNDGQITEPMFLNFYPEINQYLRIDDVRDLFDHISIDSLASHNNLEFEIRSKEEPCLKFYKIEFQNDTLTLVTGTNSNTDFVSGVKEPDEETFGDECEFASFWIFRFDGQRLIFARQLAAG